MCSDAGDVGNAKQIQLCIYKGTRSSVIGAGALCTEESDQGIFAIWNERIM